jgi:TonB family protein
MDGPIGAPGGQVTGRRRTGTPEGVVGGSPNTPPEAIIAVADLRSPPGEPGGVGERLQRLYPTRLRSMSIEGSAVVRIRISANGSVSRLRVLRASEPEFGQACLTAVREAGAWRAAVGPDGQPAATEIRYNCEFSLAY